MCQVYEVLDMVPSTVKQEDKEVGKPEDPGRVLSPNRVELLGKELWLK